MKSYLGSVSLRHDGCFSEASERFPGVRMAVVDARMLSRGLYYNRMAIFCPDRQTLEGFARRLGSHPNIKDIRVLHRFRSGDVFVGIADLRAKNASRSVRSVLTSLGRDAVVHPNVEHSGLENVSVTTSDRETLRLFYERMAGACEIVKMSRSEFKGDRFRRDLEKELMADVMRQAEEFSYLFSLTRRQAEALGIACRFRGIRGAKMREMAGAMGVAPSTFRQHLDSGLFKLLPLISRMASSVPSDG